MGIKINGVSIPVGGISWEYTESKKKGIQEMFYYLESKRILTNPMEMEIKEWSEKSAIEIKNKLQIGDELEIIVPFKLEPIAFKIEKLWNYDTEEKIESVSPGVKGQKVKMKLPIKCEKDWILRRKK